jgi:hypothetical protein
MPTLHYRVEAPGAHILKTIQDQVIYGLLDELDLTETFKDSVYPMSSFMASSDWKTNGASTLVKSRCDVEIAYIMDKGQVPWPVDSPYNTTAQGLRTKNKGNHTPIFIDEVANVSIEQYTVACALDMNFVLSFATFDEATRAFDTIQAKYRGTLIQTPFDIAFSYPVSMGMLMYLVSAYKAKADYKNKGFMDYINDMKRTEISFDVRKSELTSEDPDKELMIRCQQLNCLAQLTMDQKEPEVIRLNQLAESYSISFNFVFQFGRPNIVAVNTPISIDNTVLPYGLFESTLANFHNNPLLTGAYQDLMCHEFMTRNGGSQQSLPLIRNPKHDDWQYFDKQYSFYKYKPFLIAHFTLDGPTSTINLNDSIGGVSLHPIVKEILMKMGNRIFDYGGLFHVGVYANTLKLSKPLVNLDEDLNLTVRSDRMDKEYHLVFSETTLLSRMMVDWDDLLIKYRYFFPMTIERNIQELIEKKYFYIDYDNSFLTLLSRLNLTGKLKPLLKTMVALGEDTNQIYHFTQNTSQLADYLVYTQSLRDTYELPQEDGEQYDRVRSYYSTTASVEGRSLFVAFIEQCLLNGYLTLANVPKEYLKPSKTMYPYYNGQGGYYGFNTPLRVINYSVVA